MSRCEEMIPPKLGHLIPSLGAVFAVLVMLFLGMLPSPKTSALEALS